MIGTPFDRRAIGENDTASSIMAREGFSAARRQYSAAREAKILAVSKLFGDCLSGKEDPLVLREALNPRNEFIVDHIRRSYPAMRFLETMSVTDFAQYLTVDVLDRQLWGRWAITTIPNQALVKMETLRDFRTVKRFEVNGGVKPFRKQINPAEPPIQRALTPVNPITYSPDLYQGEMSVNWRAIVSDDMGIFKAMTDQLGDSWRLTKWQAISQLFADANGPNANLYSDANANILKESLGASRDNPPLDFQGLIDGRKILGKKLSPDGFPIMFTGPLYLVYGPGLAQTAEALVKATSADISVGGGTTNAQGFPSQRLRVDPSYITGGLTLVEDKFLPLITTTGTVADTMCGCWFTILLLSRGRPRSWANCGAMIPRRSISAHRTPFARAAA